MYKMLKVSQILIKCSSSSSNTNLILPTLARISKYSSASSLVKEAKNTENEGNNKSSSGKSYNQMVAAAFASLNSEEIPTTTVIGGDIKTPHTDDKILKASTINELLAISEGTGISRRHALKVVSVLADWSNTGKVSLTEFESDPRFVRLCRVLTKNNLMKNNRLASRSEDLSTILSVTADDEAAKLVGSITLPQMVKVVVTLCQKKRRSTSLLRALSYNITASPEKLDLKQSADLLYSITTLNFPDENLLGRIANDVCLELLQPIAFKRSSVVGSIITSLGLLRYKDPVLLDSLSEWIIKSQSKCRSQDLFSLIMTFAVLNYTPSNADNLYQVLLPQLTQSEAGKAVAWLEAVWSLVLLNIATVEHVSSVLNEDFIGKLQGLNPSVQLKLLNIEAYARYFLVDNFEGPRLDFGDVTMLRSKEKNEMVDALVDTLRNLIQNDSLLRTKVDSGAGFFIDAECFLDKKCNPLPVNLKESPEGAKRIAILALDYTDMCRNKLEPTGINTFAMKLLKKMGYSVLPISYTDFRSKDKVVQRVKLLETKLKDVIAVGSNQ